ncbi:hypothetical protein GCM10023264_18680 [Sphingomonas daechungensis]|uniref:DUF5666 domain-containing protein n=1 Tax=Sphingomonas daechungensis TaxID=1176646 RepID=A0ABX6T281_9SPHN|nr:hypothetical protein [Sphingomonas daechungensis]QNP43972.1 hypothetical protein H9L15_05045 [Sphingomonas daechungensis]
MKMVSKGALLIGAAMLAVTGFAGVAFAQANQGNKDQATPRGWNYEIRDGKRVPKGGNRITNPDGSWREETRQGSCVTVKEKTAAGEYKESRRCD